MFDVLLLPFRCPICNNEESMHHWQTRALDCLIDEYSIGQKMVCSTFIMINGKITTYASCNKCRQFINAHAIVSDGVLTGEVEYQ